MEKYCSRCKRDLELNAFSLNRCTKDGLATWCRECNSEYHRKRIADNRARNMAARKQEKEKD